MTNYIDLTKLFIRSLRINKHNRKGGKFFFYALILLTIIFAFIPILFIYTLFVYNAMDKLNRVDFATTGLEALLFVIAIFSFIFAFNVLLNELYFSEDIENMLPLPVKPETIAASKFTSCFLIENVFLFIFLILGILAYTLALKLPVYNLLISLIGIIFLPLIPMILCTIVLFVVINILRKFLTNKAIKNIGFVLLGIFILLTFYALWKISSFNFEKYIESFALGDHKFLEVMRYLVPSVSLFTKGVSTGNFGYILLSILVSIVYFVIMVLLAKKLYYNSVVDITSKDTESKKRSLKAINDFEVRNPIVQYFFKDIKLIFRSPTFFINCIVINIIWPVLIYLIFKIALPTYNISFMRDALSNNNPLFLTRLTMLVIGISIIIPSFNSLASSAFSREGKNYHFMKYIPVKYGIQWREKYFLSFIISFIGIIIYALPFFIIIHVPLLRILLYLVLIILSISIVSLLGLLIDSVYPKLIWDDEADSLRENYNAFIAMGYSILLFVILCGGGYYLIKKGLIPLSLFTFIALLILITGNVILYAKSDEKITKNIIKQEV